ncbi:universal stress protein [Leptolyngbya sp. FACHB-261]|uniref:universal stress protein n=1 Tax=Leptolyngbya sp. FACHB-261 TaxID=2692806 RepID=UPI0016867B88|nr:universal stress protein [Leptolyngbya sp. FACHB-261]MBD2103266.1 universal stress protein [Leptolyngbya sp. FACHB-261]
MVPYAAGVHDDLGLELALRLLMEHDDCTLTVLRVREPGEQEPELSYEFQTVLAQLPEALRSRVSTPVTEASDPLATVVKASTEADLTIVGASREWGLERQTLGRHADELAVECKSSLLIARKYSGVTSHMASVMVGIRHPNFHPLIRLKNLPTQNSDKSLWITSALNL